jgi:hypothetical protein
MKVSALWNLTGRSLAESWQRFGGTCCFHHMVGQQVLQKRRFIFCWLAYRHVPEISDLHLFLANVIPPVHGGGGGGGGRVMHCFCFDLDYAWRPTCTPTPSCTIP